MARARIAALARKTGRLLPVAQAHAPLRQETVARDVVQRQALAHRHYGYRCITAALRRDGLLVNRLMRDDNLLCPRNVLSCLRRRTPGMAGGWCRTWRVA